MLFRKKALSEELKLDKIILDIKNIAHANPNAALSQLRTFVEMYTNAVLIYEDKETGIDLIDKINTIKQFNLLTDDEIELIHQIRKSGNNAVHSYYYSKEEVLTYLEVCINIYNKFIEKYEKDKINYKKKLMKSYLSEIKEENIDTEEDYEQSFEKNYNGRLISQSSVSVAKEEYDIDKLESYEYLRKRLINNTMDVKEISKELGIKDENLDITIKKLDENKFNLVVLGEFNRGKSTFLNALLGKIILPSNILPTTSVITRIHYSEEPKVKVTLNNGRVEDVSHDELVKYVTTLDGNDSTHIDITDVYYPTNLCKNGCIITDTPGVNDLNEQNIAITENYIPQADAVIFMLDPDQVFTESEKHFIKNKVLKNDIDKIFFIVNKFDSINKESIDSFKKYVYKTIADLGLDSKVYFLSSKKALINKIHERVDEYSNDFEEFSNEIEKFLINEKGKYILLNGCNRLKTSIESVIKNIYEIEADALKSLDKLEDDYKKFTKVSHDVALNKNDIMTKINREYADFRDDVKKIIYKELTLSFEKLIDDVYRQAEFTDAVFRELENNINTSINKWINVRVNPFVLSRVNKINSDLMDLLKDSLAHINQSSSSLSTESSNMVVVQSSKFELPTCYNTVSVQYNQNVFIGAGAILTMILSGTLLSGIGGAFLGLIAHDVFSGKSKNTIKPREEIIKNIESQKTKAINSIIKGIEKSIDNSYNLNCKYIDDSINTVLDNTKKRMEVIIREKRKKNDDLDVVIDNLNNYLKQLYIIKKHNALIIKSLEG